MMDDVEHYTAWTPVLLHDHKQLVRLVNKNPSLFCPTWVLKDDVRRWLEAYAGKGWRWGLESIEKKRGLSAVFLFREHSIAILFKLTFA